MCVCVWGRQGGGLYVRTCTCHVHVDIYGCDFEIRVIIESVGWLVAWEQCAQCHPCEGACMLQLCVANIETHEDGKVCPSGATDRTTVVGNEASRMSLSAAS